METRTRSTAYAAIAAIVLAMSCATPPKTAEPPAPAPAAPAPQIAETPPAPPAETAVPAPDELRSKAAELRKKAFDLGMKAVLPEDYAAADKAFAAGNAGYGKDNASSAASFTDAVARYEDVLARGLPILAAAEGKRAALLRGTAAGKGAETTFPELFAYAEAELAKPAEAEVSGDFEAAIKGYRASSRHYEVLYKLCDASAARESIVARDFAKWDPSNWTLAETRFRAAQDILRQDAAAAATSADEAILRYGIASRTALEYYASERKLGSEGERERALGIKSEVAVRDEFETAVAIHDQAEAAHSAKDFDGSSSLYDRAAAAFASAYEHAKIKMDGAKGELDSLDEAMAVTETAAGSAR